MKFQKGQEIILEKLEQWWIKALKIVPNFIFALFVLALFKIAGRTFIRIANALIKNI